MIEREEIQQMLEDCNEARTCSNSPFSPWEKEFIESVTDQFDQRGSLSPKQLDILGGLWDKV